MNVVVTMMRGHNLIIKMLTMPFHKSFYNTIVYQLCHKSVDGASTGSCCNIRLIL